MYSYRGNHAIVNWGGFDKCLTLSDIQLSFGWILGLWGFCLFGLRLVGLHYSVKFNKLIYRHSLSLS